MVLLDSKGLAKAGAPHARGKCPIPLGGHIERECEGPAQYILTNINFAMATLSPAVIRVFSLICCFVSRSICRLTHEHCLDIVYVS